MVNLEENNTYFYFNRDKLIHNFNIYNEYGKIYYPLKTNSNKIIIETLKDKFDNGFLISSISNFETLQQINIDISKICFINVLAEYVHEVKRLKVGWYSGRTHVSTSICKSNFDYIKVGPYIKHLGCLKDMTTNQRLYKRVSGDEFSDITSRFWRKKD